jgi:hypothetical protein
MEGGMSTRRCLSCGRIFDILRHIPRQLYCSDPTCQRERKRQWQQEKRKNDADYQDNQRRAQRAWLDKHPDYWRIYRDTHPEYAERNRVQQRTRTATKQADAKMDESSSSLLLPAGIYQLQNLSSDGAPQGDILIVEITLLIASKKSVPD